MQIDQKKASVLLGYLGEAIKILSALLYTPIMLRLLGQSEYGLYQLAVSTVSCLRLLNMGFINSYFRFHSRYHVKGDTDGIARLNGMFMMIFGAIAALCVICGAVMVVNAHYIFDTGLTAAETEKVKILMAILVVNMAVSLFDIVFYCYVMASEKFVFQKLVNVFQSLLTPLLTLPLLLLGCNSVAVVVIMTLLTIAVFLMNLGFCLKKLNMQFSFHGIERSLLREMAGFAFFIFLNQMVNQVNWNVDKMLLGRLSGTVAVAVYGIGMQIYWLYNDVAVSMSGVFIPQINNIVAESNDNRKLTALMTRVGRVQFLLLALILSGFAFFGRSFIQLWAGDGYEESYWVALLLMLPMTVPLIQTLGVEIQRAKNKHRVRSVVYAGIALVNICISVVFIKRWGCVGAVAGTTISLVAGEILFMNWYYHKKIGLDILAFWKEIGKLLPAVGLVCLFGVAYTHFVQVSGWAMLLLSVVVYTVVYGVIMWLAGLNTYEKQLVGNILRKLPGRAVPPVRGEKG